MRLVELPSHEPLKAVVLVRRDEARLKHLEFGHDFHEVRQTLGLIRTRFFVWGPSNE